MRKVFLIIAIISLTGCENPFWSSSPNKQLPIEYTYNDEAALMAMSYYDLYTPVDSIAQRIYDELKILKLSFQDTTRFISYTPAWHPSLIPVTLNEEMLESIRDSSDTIFYNFLESIDADSLHFYNLGESFKKFATIYLNGLKNPTIQILPLEELPQVTRADYSSSPGDWSNIFPYFEDNKSKYFYTYKYGDCPAGCIYWNVSYFEIVDDSVILHDYKADIWYSSETPPWADTFEVAYLKWAYYDLLSRPR